MRNRWNFELAKRHYGCVCARVLSLFTNLIRVDKILKYDLSRWLPNMNFSNRIDAMWKSPYSIPRSALQQIDSKSYSTVTKSSESSFYSRSIKSRKNNFSNGDGRNGFSTSFFMKFIIVLDANAQDDTETNSCPSSCYVYFTCAFHSIWISFFHFIFVFHFLVVLFLHDWLDFNQYSTLSLIASRRRSYQKKNTKYICLGNSEPAEQIINLTIWNVKQK